MQIKFSGSSLYNLYFSPAESDFITINSTNRLDSISQRSHFMDDLVIKARNEIMEQEDKRIMDMFNSSDIFYITNKK